MEKSYKYIFGVFFQLVLVFYVYAGCGYLRSDFTVTGNYVYDSVSSTYSCHEGDTLAVIYNGTGGGQGYTEDYYFGGIFLGSRLDTIKIFSNGILQVQQGCSNADYILNRSFIFSSANSVNELSDSNLKISTSYDPETHSISLILKSTTVSNFDIQIYSVSGEKITELQNLSEGINYSLKITMNGLSIVRVNDRKGHIINKKIIVF